MYIYVQCYRRDFSIICKSMKLYGAPAPTRQEILVTQSFSSSHSPLLSLLRLLFAIMIIYYRQGIQCLTLRNFYTLSYIRFFFFFFFYQLCICITCMRVSLTCIIHCILDASCICLYIRIYIFIYVQIKQKKLNDNFSLLVLLCPRSFYSPEKISRFNLSSYPVIRSRCRYK